MKQFWILDFGFSMGRSKSRKMFGLAATALLLALSFPAEAQQTKQVPRIGFLLSGTLSANANRIEGFRQGLQALGYVEGQNIAFEYRWTESKSERFPELVAELVRLNVQIILAPSTQASLAAKQATTTIPIVMIQTADPVQTGIIASLARPGGNITGLTQLTPELVGKRLELLKEIVAKLSNVAVLLDPSNPAQPVSLREMEGAAPALGMHLRFFRIGTIADFETAIQSARKERVGALVFLPIPLIGNDRKRNMDLVAKTRLPAMYPEREWVEAGGLISYGVNYPDLWRRAATFVDKILKGRKPADLPVERPMKFELIINLKTAKQIGLTIPQSVLYRADKVIK
jgi:ABC-type uncharacterized transport system substrate-binding protein